MAQEPQKSNSVLIIVAIITVIGSIIASSISTKGNYNIEKMRQDAELTKIALVSQLTQAAPQNGSNNPLESIVLTATPYPILNAIALGQDGYDYAVSGCYDGVQGSIGVIDNHIRLSGVENINNIESIEIQYGNSARWQSPCKYPAWEIFFSQSSEGVLELYFEPEGYISKEVTFSIILTYKDGGVMTTTAVGVSGKNQ